MLVADSRAAAAWHRFRSGFAGVGPERRSELLRRRAGRVDGHDHVALLDAFDRARGDRPTCVIANTTKKMGVSFMENRVVWHRYGTDVTVVATGTMVSRALQAAGEAAAEGMYLRVLNMSTIAPLDERAIRPADIRAATATLVRADV